jgi:RimJ/RimL family protein N-acetyltransferase
MSEDRAHPILHTERLTLRAFEPRDAGRIKLLAGDEAVIDTMMSLPHPIDDAQAEQIVRSRAEMYAQGTGVAFAVALAETDELIGAVAVHINAEKDITKMNYWIGRAYWGRGYCTEAVRAAVAFALDHLPVDAIRAIHFSRNVASGRVMRKIGMRHLQHLPQRCSYRGRVEDLEVYVVTKADMRGLPE